MPVKEVINTCIFMIIHIVQIVVATAEKNIHAANENVSAGMQLHKIQLN